MEISEFGGKVAFLTGGGAGIGRETAKLLARRGASVMISDLDPAAANTVAEEIRAAGGRAAATGLDVSDENAPAQAIKETIRQFGRLDCCVNNAGVATPPIDIAEIPTSEWRRQIAVNLTGVLLSMQAELRAMRDRKSGSIVNLASLAGLVGVANRAAYVAAKHGVVGLTRAAALDYATRGVRINAIAPGYADTPLLADRSPEERAEIAARHPMNRMAAPAEIAEAILFLLSERSGFVTGTVLSADGGFTAR